MYQRKETDAFQEVISENEKWRASSENEAQAAWQAVRTEEDRRVGAKTTWMPKVQYHIRSDVSRSGIAFAAVSNRNKLDILNPCDRDPLNKKFYKL